MFEHRTYFPLVCLSIAAALVLARIDKRPLVPLAAVLLVLLFLGTVARNRVWHEDRSLWADVVAKAPGKARGYFHLAQSYASENPARARELYERGLQLDPVNADGQTNLALVLLSQGEVEAALIHLRKALAVGGDNPLVWNNMGAAHLRRGDLEDAVKCFRKALEVDPCRFDARLNLMRTLSASGQDEEVAQVASIPPNCRLLPQQVARIEEEREALR
jgi:tetratricopeptide (TPR) repeat protein